jgi:hypothetical protein
VETFGDGLLEERQPEAGSGHAGCRIEADPNAPELELRASSSELRIETEETRLRTSPAKLARETSNSLFVKIAATNDVQGFWI